MVDRIYEEFERKGMSDQLLDVMIANTNLQDRNKLRRTQNKFIPFGQEFGGSGVGGDFFKARSSIMKGETINKIEDLFFGEINWKVKYIRCLFGLFRAYIFRTRFLFFETYPFVCFFSVICCGFPLPFLAFQRVFFMILYFVSECQKSVQEEHTK